MTRLLVSVRNADEARLALQGGADLIDVKEPRLGSLGAADGGTIAAVLQAVAGAAPVSVALGELLDSTLPQAQLPAGVALAKTGLAGCAQIADWAARWTRRIGMFPVEVRSVAVVYADELARCPPWKEVVKEAAACQCAAVLLDTWQKSAGGLAEHWSTAEIGDFILSVQKQRMLAVVAGGLTLETLLPIVRLRPDVVAVRGAVCRGGRTGSLDGDRVQRWKQILASAPDEMPMFPLVTQTS